MKRFVFALAVCSLALSLSRRASAAELPPMDTAGRLLQAAAAGVLRARGAE